MELTYQKLFNIHIGQDGAVYNGLLFRFETDGRCWVYDVAQQTEIGHFTLDKSDILIPHCNAVCFGSERYEETDEFPLLYANLYNSYANESDRMEGVCCVYRIQRTQDGFTSTLVQLIRIGFTENLALWKSLESNGDIRPYGNFVVDTERQKLYAFVIRDKERVTRFFEFSLPRMRDGVLNSAYGVPVVLLQESDICNWFDCNYTYYIQGACCRNGKIYSIEGGTVSPEKKPEKAFPRLMIVDMVNRDQLCHIDLYDLGLYKEPELIDFDGDFCYYADNLGSVYQFIFE